jgi:hypothetical protein
MKNSVFLRNAVKTVAVLAVTTTVFVGCDNSINQEGESPITTTDTVNVKINDYEVVISDDIGVLLEQIEELIASAEMGNEVSLTANNDILLSSEEAKKLSWLMILDNVSKSGNGKLLPSELKTEINGITLLKFNGFTAETKAAKLRSDDGDDEKNWFYVWSYENADTLLNNPYGIIARTNILHHGPESSPDLNYLIPDTLQQQGEAIDSRGFQRFEEEQINTLIIPEEPQKDVVLAYADEKSLGMTNSPKFSGTSNYVKMQKEAIVAPLMTPGSYSLSSPYGLNIKNVQADEEGNVHEKVKHSYFNSQMADFPGYTVCPFGMNDTVNITFSENSKFISDGRLMLGDANGWHISPQYGIRGRDKFPVIKLNFNYNITTNPVAITLVLTDDMYKALIDSRNVIGEETQNQLLKERVKNMRIAVDDAIINRGIQIATYSMVQGRVFE